jgi:hypothetical protein
MGKLDAGSVSKFCSSSALKVEVLAIHVTMCETVYLLQSLTNIGVIFKIVRNL